jgi:hypothetical protein
MTNYMKKKLEKSKWKYQLHDDFGCIREFRTQDCAKQWQHSRPELKLVIVKPTKINVFEVTDNFDPFDIPF